MAISPYYALRETAQNLWRNLLLSLATIITIGVSLWLFGGFFLFNYAVDNATARSSIATMRLSSMPRIVPRQAIIVSTSIR